MALVGLQTIILLAPFPLTKLKVTPVFVILLNCNDTAFIVGVFVKKNLPLGLVVAAVDEVVVQTVDELSTLRNLAIPELNPVVSIVAVFPLVPPLLLLKQVSIIKL